MTCCLQLQRYPSVIQEWRKDWQTSWGLQGRNRKELRRITLYLLADRTASAQGEICQQFAARMYEVNYLQKKNIIFIHYPRTKTKRKVVGKARR